MRIEAFQLAATLYYVTPYTCIMETRTYQLIDEHTIHGLPDELLHVGNLLFFLVAVDLRTLQRDAHAVVVALETSTFLLVVVHVRLQSAILVHQL